MEILADNSMSPKPTIFHLKFYPCGITQQQVQTAYSETIKPIIPKGQLLIDVSQQYAVPYYCPITKEITPPTTKSTLGATPGHRKSCLGHAEHGC
jgi:hypothetical protein